MNLHLKLMQKTTCNSEAEESLGNRPTKFWDLINNFSLIIGLSLYMVGISSRNQWLIM